MGIRAIEVIAIGWGGALLRPNGSSTAWGVLGRCRRRRQRVAAGALAPAPRTHGPPDLKAGTSGPRHLRGCVSALTVGSRRGVLVKERLLI